MKEKQIERRVKDFVSGDRGAFTDIQNFLAPVLKQAINSKRYIRESSSREDIEQECWLDLIENIHTWDPKKGSLKGYFFRCFVNCAMGYAYKDGKHAQKLSFDELEGTIESPQPFHKNQDLEMMLGVRFSDARTRYIIQTVCLSVFLKVFSSSKNRILSRLRELTGWKNSKIRFYIDYSLVLIRKKFLEEL